MRYADSHCVWSEEMIDGEQWYIYKGPCIITKKQVTVKVPAEGLFYYRKTSMPIQQCFPDMDDGDREFLISGISKEAWAETFETEDY